MEELNKLERAGNSLKRTKVLYCMKCERTSDLFICEQGHPTCYCHACLKATVKQDKFEKFKAKCEKPDCNFMPMNREGGLVGYTLPDKKPSSIPRDFAIATIAYYLRQTYHKYHFSDFLYNHIATRYWDERGTDSFSEWASKHWVESVENQDIIKGRSMGKTNVELS